MKTIKIKALQLTNFKGIRSLKLDELSDETFIYGDNGVGKTTIFDAFTWLLFGKDSTGRQVFEIKTLDSNNNVIPKLDHEVEALLDVDGQTVTLKRILREKWVTRRGSLEPEFTGNDTTYEWNGVPMNASEYNSKINAIIDENIFKMITNPAAFNSLKWTEQREVLIDISGNISDEDVAKGNAEFEALLQSISGKSFDERKKEVKANISKSKNELKAIPTRIDEVERSKPDTSEFKGDFDGLKHALSVKDIELQGLNDQVSDKLKAQQSDIDAQQQTQQEMHAITSEVNNTKHQLQQQATDAYNKAQENPRDIQRKIDAVDADIRANDTLIANGKSRIGSYDNQIKGIERQIVDLRKEWEAENAKEFKMDDSECACPTCKRAFEASEIEDKRNDLKEHFDSNKKSKLSALTQKGQSLSGQKMTLINGKSDLEKEVAEKEAENTELWNKRSDLSAELKDAQITKTQAEFYQELVDEKHAFFTEKTTLYNEKKAALENRPKVDTSELKSKIDALNTERDAIKRNLLKEQQIEAANKRVEELSAEEKHLGQTIANLERELFTMEAFEKEKSTRIEKSVNSRFSMVDFKLFETQINGGEKPTCKALINGVPFSDANTASKINAGLDIINTLCNHYQASAPVFIDNRESVVELIPTQSQIINLIVSEADKKLRVECMRELQDIALKI